VLLQLYEPGRSLRVLVEYERMVDTFSAEGIKIIFLTDVLKHDTEALRYISRRPNLVFMRDMATVYEQGAVIMNPYLKGHQWGGWVVKESLDELVAVNAPQGTIHLDSLFMVIDENLAFLSAAELDIAPTRVLWRDGSVEYVWFKEYLEALGFECLYGSKDLDMSYLAYVPRAHDRLRTNTWKCRSDRKPRRTIHRHPWR
jgi:N-dimethylarginine dimethylaminohydrolase